MTGYCLHHGVHFPAGQRYFRFSPHADRFQIWFQASAAMVIISALFWDITAALCGNCLPTFRVNVSLPSSRVKSPRRPLKIRCPETSVNKYQTTSRNIPEERRSIPTQLSVCVYFVLGKAARSWNWPCPLVVRRFRTGRATFHVLSPIINSLVLDQIWIQFCFYLTYTISYVLN